MQKTDKNPRRDFLKMIPVALVSIGAFSFFNFRRSSKYSDVKFNSLSVSEADEIIKNEKFPLPARINPEPAPVGQKNIKE